MDSFANVQTKKGLKPKMLTLKSPFTFWENFKMMQFYTKALIDAACEIPR